VEIWSFDWNDVMTTRMVRVTIENRDGTKKLYEISMDDVEYSLMELAEDNSDYLQEVKDGETQATAD
jgi:hypothetical protein